ncbi:hypothetical protein HDU91_002798, partial [Kappamyces sp. JEL0680]
TGTYWVHSHKSGQYPDGMRAPLIISDPQDPIKYGYDAEYVMALSEWYHEYYMNLYANFSAPYENQDGFEPIPNSGLMNDGSNQVFSFTPGLTYRLRFVSMATYIPLLVWIDGHNMTIIEVDGVMVKPYTVSSLPLAAAQRYSVLVKALPKAQATQNYLIHYNLDTNMFLATLPLPVPFVANHTALIQYKAGATTFPAGEPLSDPEAFDDTVLVPAEAIPATVPDVSMRLDVLFNMYTDFVNHGTFNGSVYEFPLVPAVFTAMSTGANATNASVYGPWSRSFVLPHLKTVQLLLVSQDRESSHPFHLHGQVFQVLGKGSLTLPFHRFNYGLMSSLVQNPNPLRRDTVVIPKDGWVVIQFYTDNPGVWLWHCHIQ